MKMRMSNFLVALAGLFFMTSCTTYIKDPRGDTIVYKAAQRNIGTGKIPSHATRNTNRLDPLPKNIKTIKVKKGIPVHLYMHADGTLDALPTKAKDWQPVAISKQSHYSWFARLVPQDGVSLGIYTIFSAVIAVYNDPGGYEKTANFRVRYLIRRGNTEFEIFKVMMRSKGQRYQVVTLENREIPQETKIKKGDILVLRLEHRKGNASAVGLRGGKVGIRTNFVTISPHALGDYIQKLN